MYFCSKRTSFAWKENKKSCVVAKEGKPNSRKQAKVRKAPPIALKRPNVPEIITQVGMVGKMKSKMANRDWPEVRAYGPEGVLASRPYETQAGAIAAIATEDRQRMAASSIMAPFTSKDAGLDQA